MFCLSPTSSIHCFLTPKITEQAHRARTKKQKYGALFSLINGAPFLSQDRLKQNVASTLTLITIIARGISS